MANMLPFRRPKIGLVVCANLDYFHGAGHLHMAYIVWNDKMLDDPDYQTCLRILKAYEGKREVEIVMRTCLHCKRKGAH